LTSFNGHQPVITDTSEQARESLKLRTERPVLRREDEFWVGHSAQEILVLCNGHRC
jgi:hypothetical protein